MLELSSMMLHHLHTSDRPKHRLTSVNKLQRRFKIDLTQCGSFCRWIFYWINCIDNQTEKIQKPKLRKVTKAHLICKTAQNSSDISSWHNENTLVLWCGGDTTLV